MELLLVLIAPVLQIIFSVRRIISKTKLSIIAIAALAVIAGVIFSFLMAWIMIYRVTHLPDNGFHCVTGEVVGAIGFAMLNAMFAGICGVVFGIWYYCKQSR